MIKTTGNYIVRIGGKLIGRIAKWGFWTAITIFGPGPIISVVGVPGLVAGAVISQTGLIEYYTKKILTR